MRLLFTCLLLAAFTAPDLNAQWGPRPCVSVETPHRQLLPVRYWAFPASDPGRIYVYENGYPVGCYCTKEGFYRDCDVRTQTWSAIKPPPADVPFSVLVPPVPATQPTMSKKTCNCCDTCECGDPCPCKGTLKTCHDACKCVLSQKVASDVVQDFGMGWRPSGKEAYSRGGHEINKAEAHAAVGDNKLQDDSSFLRVTAISANAADRQKVLDDFKTHPALTPFKDRVLLQGYTTADWAVARAGFKTDGRPTVYVQAPSGEVLHRQDNYDDGAEGLARALRKLKPYNPAKDPDLRKDDGFPAGVPDWLKNPQVLLGGAVLVLLFLLFRLKKG